MSLGHPASHVLLVEHLGTWHLGTSHRACAMPGGAVSWVAPGGDLPGRGDP